MTGNYSSEELFHFVGRRDPADHERNYAMLRRVIGQGCVSHPPHDQDWGSTSLLFDPDRSLLSEELLVPSVTCYCDIPFDHLAVHVAKYGCFGVSFARTLLVKYGARPVSYVPLAPDDWGGPFGATLLKDIECVFRALKKHRFAETTEGESRRSVGQEPTTAREMLSALESVMGKDFLAFLKPFDSTLSPDHQNNFYMEREWRKFGNLCFEPTDIMRIVVEPSFLARARNDFTALVEKIHRGPPLPS